MVEHALPVVISPTATTTNTAIAPPATHARALARLVSSTQGVSLAIIGGRKPEFNFEILCRQVAPHFIMKAPGSHTKPYHTMPSKPPMPWLDETRRASARAWVAGGAMAVLGVVAVDQCENFNG